MRTPVAIKTADGYVPGVEYPDGSKRMLEFQPWPDGPSALARAERLESLAFHGIENPESAGQICGYSDSHVEVTCFGYS